MPYKSEAQRGYFHTKSAANAGITPAMVSEYDSASKGKKLPARSTSSTRQDKNNNRKASK